MTHSVRVSVFVVAPVAHIYCKNITTRFTIVFLLATHLHETGKGQVYIIRYPPSICWIDYFISANMYQTNGVVGPATAGNFNAYFATNSPLAAVPRGINVNYMTTSLAALSALPTYQSDANIKVTLDNRHLWESFNRHTTEMIITKTGRRMFPVIKMSVTGLEKTSRYYVIIDVMPVDDVRYKFHSSEWVGSGKADPHCHGRSYIHPDSPATGAQWMRQAISFNKVKLTNNNFDQNGQIILNSMHKYQPRVHFIRQEDMIAFNYRAFNTIAFPETAFIAVTAYQNEQITRLKIDNNPFAKGFRDLRQIGGDKSENRWPEKRQLVMTDEHQSSEKPAKMAKMVPVVTEGKSLSPGPADSSCSPVMHSSMIPPSMLQFCPNPSLAWQQQYVAQNYMNYFQPQNWMFSPAAYQMATAAGYGTMAPFGNPQSNRPAQ